MINVDYIATPEQWEAAKEIRKVVFVIEQKVPEEEEYDEFEETARHFLATENGKPLGTARWRFTQNGAKLERFAVLEEARGKGVGSALVQAVINDVKAEAKNPDLLLYMHAQVSAVGLYGKFGFEQEGDQFDECGIMHYLMSKKLSAL